MTPRDLPPLPDEAPRLIGVAFKPDLCAAIVEGRKTVTRRSSFRGKPGDVLYVKEALAKGPRSTVNYQRDGEPALTVDCRAVWDWKPDRLAAMYMPRWAARTFRRIVDVRTEHLRLIDEADAQREGVERAGGAETYRAGFALKWDAINGKRPGMAWSDNPLVVRVAWSPIPVDEAGNIVRWRA